jgi:hypothetical protein
MSQNSPEELNEDKYLNPSLPEGEENSHSTPKKRKSKKNSKKDLQDLPSNLEQDILAKISDSSVIDTPNKDTLDLRTVEKEDETKNLNSEPEPVLWDELEETSKSKSKETPKEVTNAVSNAVSNASIQTTAVLPVTNVKEPKKPKKQAAKTNLAKKNGKKGAIVSEETSSSQESYEDKLVENEEIIPTTTHLNEVRGEKAEEDIESKDLNNTKENLTPQAIKKQRGTNKKNQLDGVQEILKGKEEKTPSTDASAKPSKKTSKLAKTATKTKTEKKTSKPTKKETLAQVKVENNVEKTPENKYPKITLPKETDTKVNEGKTNDKQVEVKIKKSKKSRLSDDQISKAKRMGVILGVLIAIGVFVVLGLPKFKEIFSGILPEQEEEVPLILGDDPPVKKEELQNKDGAMILKENSQEGESTLSIASEDEGTIILNTSQITSQVKILPENRGLNASISVAQDNISLGQTKLPEKENQFCVVETEVDQVAKSTINPKRRYISILHPDDPSKRIIVESSTKALVGLLDNKTIKSKDTARITLGFLNKKMQEKYKEERKTISKKLNAHLDNFYSVEEYQILPKEGQKENTKDSKKPEDSENNKDSNKSEEPTKKVNNT